MPFASESPHEGSALATLDAELSYSQTVRRELVHKAAVSEVLLTDSIPVDDDRFLVAAQWPRKHWHFGEPGRTLNPMLVAETFRQSCLLVAARYLGMSEDSHFVIDTIGLRTEPVRLSRREPCRVTVAMTSARRMNDCGRLRDVAISADVAADGILVATAKGTGTVIPGPVYQRIRPSTTQKTRAEVAPTAVGRAHPFHVDRDHAVYFDHDSDHVPGMLLIDTALGLARTLTGAASRVRGFDATFHGFLDFEPTPRVESRVEVTTGDVCIDFVGTARGGARVVVATQNDRGGAR